MAAGLFVRNVVRKVLLEDWVLKLVALAITCGLWLGATGLGTHKKERFNAVPLALRVSNDAEITNAPVQEVSLILSGDSRRIDEVRQADLYVSVDLSDVKPGDLIVTLSPDGVSVPLPRGVKLEEIQPSRIPVKMEAVEEKDVDVDAVTEGTPAAGYEIYSINVTPAKIRVHGPKDYIDTLASLPTEKINVAGKKEDFTAKQIPVLITNPKATVLATVVDIQFRIGEKRVERTFTAPLAGSPGKTATFSVYGPKTALAKVKADAFRIEMFLNDKGEEAAEVTMPAELQDTSEVRKVTVK